MNNFKEYITKKENKVSENECFNKIIMKQPDVRERINDLLETYSNMDLSELLTLTEFQYLRSISENQSAIRTGDDFNPVTMLYSLLGGEVMSVRDITHLTDLSRLSESEYSKEYNNSDVVLIVSCDPYGFYAQFSNENGSGLLVATNDHLGDEISITTSEIIDEDVIVDHFSLDSTSVTPKVLRHREILSKEDELER